MQCQFRLSVRLLFLQERSTCLSVVLVDCIPLISNFTFILIMVLVIGIMLFSFQPGPYCLTYLRSGSDRPIVGISQLRRSLSLVLCARPLGDGLLRTERHTYPQLPALLALCATHTLSWRNPGLNRGPFGP